MTPDEPNSRQRQRGFAQIADEWRNTFGVENAFLNFVPRVGRSSQPLGQNPVGIRMRLVQSNRQGKSIRRGWFSTNRFFIPITFVAGVYGMNFEVLRELKWKYSYAVFWSVCLTISISLGIFFYRKSWIGGGKSS